MTSRSRNAGLPVMAAVILLLCAAAFGEAAMDPGSSVTAATMTATEPATMSTYGEAATVPVQAAPPPVLAGACSVADREEHVHDPNPDFIVEVRRCSRATWAHRAKNIACLQTVYPSLSTQCAACFAEMAKCSLDRCALACAASDKSKGCVRCANTKCQPRLIACTGVPRKDLP